MLPVPNPAASPVSTPPRAGLRARLQLGGTFLILAVALGDILRWQAVAAGRMGFGLVAPMAPATACLLGILGVALGLHLLYAPASRARRCAVGLSAIVALAALHVLFCHLREQVPPWEAWLGSRRMLVEGFSVGFISTQSALLVLLSNFALLALFSPLSRRILWRDAGIFAALVVELFALATVVSYAAGNPPVANGGWLTVAPLVMFEFTLFNFVLLIGGRATNRLRHWFFGSDPSAPDFAPVSREERLVFVLLAGAGAAALAASVIYLRIETKHYQERSIEELQRMADLKVGEIIQWRHERLADAQTLKGMPNLGENVDALSRGGPPTARSTAFVAWLRQYALAYGYANFVAYDAGLKPVASGTDAAEPSTPELGRRLRSLRPDSDVIEFPPYLNPAGRLCWDLLVPLRSSAPAALDGAILLQTDPTRFIIPILQAWPKEYKTGQSALWFAEGDLLTAFGGYRPAPGVTAAELRPFGLTRIISKLPPQSLPARMLRGETDGGEGLDYRGVMVVGAGRLIPHSTWAFASRLDSAEVYAPLRRTAIEVAGIVAGLLATTGLATSRLWRQRQRNLQHDRIAAESEQRRLAARLGLVMRHAHDIVLLTDEDMRLVDANQRATDIYGWTKEELQRMTIADLRAAESVPDLPSIYARAKTDAGVTFETLHRRRDGTSFPVEISARRVEMDGRPHVFSIIRDISERKRAEATLRASEERYRLIADNTSDLIWLYDQTADQFTYASPSALPLLGYRPEEVVGKKLLDFVAPNSGGTAQIALAQALRTAAETRESVHVVVELDQRRKDGTLVPTEVVTSVLTEASGRVTHILGISRDITERRAAREALEKFNTQLERQVETRTAELAARHRDIEALLGSIPDTVLLFDEQGNLVPTHFGGNHPGSLPGTGPAQPHPVLLEVAREFHRAASASREPIMREFDRSIDGTDCAIEARAAPAGENRLLILLRDISARRRGERIVQANLERERQLSEMKSQFISVASHEFRTPLAAATGSLELLERHAARITEGKRLELLTRAQRSLGRLTAIMDNVLQLSRADSGRVKVKRMNVDLVQFVQDLIREVEMSDRQQHPFAFQTPGAQAPVAIDTNLLNHILSNLLGNAVRYSPANTKISVVLEVNAEAFSLTVADEGIGIPAAERERVFEPFARGSNVGSISGTGLGLNIVKRYTELLGGRIELLPTERGAAFHIAIPVAGPEKAACS